MITILNYGLGNILSIKNMLKRVGFDCIITDRNDMLENATKIILPGVGHFDYGMKKLTQCAFFDNLNCKVLNEKIPVLGICLGAQMLMEGSAEGNAKGLGWIKGECTKFNFQNLNNSLPVPQMGWTDVTFKKESPLNTNLASNPRYYFVHSYHINCDNENDELATAEYGYKFTAAVNKENIYGVQFHPEKSHKFGMEILKNFAEI